MLQPGESLYLMNINLIASTSERISSEPLWRAVGKNSASDFAEWVVHWMTEWTAVARLSHPNMSLGGTLNIIATNSRLITESEHQVEFVRINNLTLRELQNTRHDRLVRYVRSEIKATTQSSSTVHLV